MSRSSELVQRSSDHGGSVRDDTRRAVDGLQLVQGGQPVQENKDRLNVFLLAPGSHGGTRIERDATVIEGLAGATFTRVVIIDVETTEAVLISGTTFASPGNSQDPLVDIRATSRVVFSGCVFDKHPTEQGNFVTVAAGGRVRFIGCLFLRGDNAGNCVNNAGVAADVVTTACARMTAAANVNVTATAEVVP